MFWDFGLTYLLQKDKLGSNMKVIKLLILTDTRVGIPGGSERHLYNFLSNISHRFEVKVVQLNPTPNSFLADGALPGRTQVELISMPLQSLFSMRGMKVLYNLSKIIRDFRPDIVVSYHEKSDILNFLLSRVSICRFVSVSSKRDMGLKLTGKLGTLIKKINPYFNLVTAPSKSIVEKYVADYGVDQNKQAVILNGVDLKKYCRLSGKSREELRRNLGLNPQRIVLISIGWLRQGKGHEFTIRALAKLPAERYQLVILGEGPDRDRLEELVDTLKLQDAVVMPGMQKNVNEWLSVADVAISASLSEGLSNALVEAMASGLPIVATDVGGNPEVVLNGHNGYLVPPENDQCLYEAITEIVKPKTFDLFGENARTRAENSFSIGAMVEKLETTYERLVVSHHD